MAKKTIIFQSPHVLVIVQPGDSSGIFVTFNEMGMVVNGDRFWGDGLFAKLKISSIGVMTTTPNWYPEDDMIGAVQAIRSVTEGRRVVTYGHSQGGYGALKYSKGLNADAVLSFCPQWSINPEDVATFDPRFHKYHDRNIRNGLRINAEDVVPRSYLIFDKQLNQDYLNARKILQFQGTTSIYCPFSGHETVRLPANTNNSGELISLLMTERVDHSNDIKKILRKSRANSEVYNRNKYLYLIKKKKYEHLERHADSLPCALAKMAIEIKLFIASERRDYNSLQELIVASPHDVLERMNIITLWTICRNNNLLEAECRIADHIVRYYTNQAFVRLHAVNTYLKVARIEDAKLELKSIIDKFNSVISEDKIKTHVNNFAKHLGMESYVDAALNSITT